MIGYLKHQDGTTELVEFIALTPGSPPPRPHPRPPGGPVDPGWNPPGVGGPGSRPPGGPVDPGWSGGYEPVDPGYGIDTGHRPTHPIYIPAPPGAHPEHPIVLPPTPPGAAIPPGTGVIVPMPEGDVPAAPPGTPADHTPYVLWFGPGTVASVVWIPPIATAKPSGKVAR
jgi:hypothetical protein